MDGTLGSPCLELYRIYEIFMCIMEEPCCPCGRCVRSRSLLRFLGRLANRPRLRLARRGLYRLFPQHRERACNIAFPVLLEETRVHAVARDPGRQAAKRCLDSQTIITAYASSIPQSAINQEGLRITYFFGQGCAQARIGNA